MMDLEYYEISVPDRNDSIMRVNLDEVYYNLRLTWNAYGGFWMLSIYDTCITLSAPSRAAAIILWLAMWPLIRVAAG